MKRNYFPVTYCILLEDVVYLYYVLLTMTENTMLSAAIKESGLKKNWISERTSISYIRLLSLEKGGKPTITEAEALSQLLGRTTRELFPDHIPSIVAPPHLTNSAN